MSKVGIAGSAHTAGDRYRRRLLAAAGLSNNLLFSNLNTTITIKSSPPKTAEETARLGIVSGFLTKRNEQHSWQRRFCTLVPHSLLYYFEDEDADAPRGIIDLEYYTDISAQPNNVVRLGAPSDAPGGQQRTFYFQAESEEEMNSWMSALIRERYFVLRDERDAYQELQHDFQAQTEDMASVMKTVGKENAAMDEVKARVEREEAEIVSQVAELFQATENAREDEPSSSSSYQKTLTAEALAALTEAGKMLVARVVDLETVLVESKRGAARVDREFKAYQEEVAKLTSSLDDEQKALGNEQGAKKASMRDVENLRRELEEAQVNVSIIERTKETAESRVTELQDQKKLLVREVKAARKTLADKQDDLAALREEKKKGEKKRESSKGSASSPPPPPPPPPGGQTAGGVASVSVRGEPSSSSLFEQPPPPPSKSKPWNYWSSNDAASSGLSEDDASSIASSSSARGGEHKTHRGGEKNNRERDNRAVVPQTDDDDDQDGEAPSQAKTSYLTGAVRAFLDERVHAKSSSSSSRKKPTLSPSDDVPPMARSEASSEQASDAAPTSPRFVLRCKRCGGSVEGPKNSTCFCKEPLLSDEVPPPKTDLSAMFKSWGTSFFSSPTAAAAAKKDLHDDDDDDDPREEEKNKKEAPVKGQQKKNEQPSSSADQPAAAAAAAEDDADDERQGEEKKNQNDDETRETEADDQKTRQPPPEEVSPADDTTTNNNHDDDDDDDAGGAADETAPTTTPEPTLASNASPTPEDASPTPQEDASPTPEDASESSSKKNLVIL